MRRREMLAVVKATPEYRGWRKGEYVFADQVRSSLTGAYEHAVELANRCPKCLVWKDLPHTVLCPERLTGEQMWRGPQKGQQCEQ